MNRKSKHIVKRNKESIARFKRVIDLMIHNELLRVSNAQQFVSNFCLLTIAYCILISFNSFSQITITSVQSGNWNSPSTWDCNCNPSNDDDAIISAGDTVTTTVSETINDVTINASGVLITNTTFRVDSDYVNNGMHSGVGSIRIADNGTPSTMGGTGIINATGSFDIEADITIPVGTDLTFTDDLVDFDMSSNSVTNNGTVTFYTDIVSTTASWMNNSGSKLNIGGNILSNDLDVHIISSSTPNTVNFFGAGTTDVRGPNIYDRLVVSNGRVLEHSGSSFDLSANDILVLSGSTIEADNGPEFDISDTIVVDSASNLLLEGSNTSFGGNLIITRQSVFQTGSGVPDTLSSVLIDSGSLLDQRSILFITADYLNNGTHTSSTNRDIFFIGDNTLDGNGIINAGSDVYFQNGNKTLLNESSLTFVSTSGDGMIVQDTVLNLGNLIVDMYIEDDIGGYWINGTNSTLTLKRSVNNFNVVDFTAQGNTIIYDGPGDAGPNPVDGIFTEYYNLHIKNDDGVLFDASGNPLLLINGQLKVFSGGIDIDNSSMTVMDSTYLADNFLAGNSFNERDITFNKTLTITPTGALIPATSSKDIIINENLINNGTIDIDGELQLLGGTQSITGTGSTALGQFLAAGSGDKTIEQDMTVEFHVNIGDKVIHLNSGATINLERTNVSLLQYTTGFFSCEDSISGLQRTMGSTTTYPFPVSAGSALQRQVDIASTSPGSHVFKVCAINDDPTNDGYPRNIRLGLGDIQSAYYWRIERISGSVPVNVTLYSDESIDGEYTTIGQWQESGKWENVAFAASINEGTSGSYKTFTINSYNDFTEPVFALAGDTIIANDTLPLVLYHPDLESISTLEILTESINPCLDLADANARLIIKLNTGADYEYGSNSFDRKVKFKLDLYSTTGGSNGFIATYEPDTMGISDSIPEKYFSVDISSHYSDIKRLILYVMNYDAVDTVEYINDNLRFEISIEAEPKYDIASLSGAITPIDLSNDSVTSNPVTFAWNTPCEDIPGYELQVLRLYNKDELNITDERVIGDAEVDWGKALSVLTGQQTSMTLTLAEGNGYYIWRVRPLGNAYPEGSARNWGNWSNAPAQGIITGYSGIEGDMYAFYYKQFDDSLNWIYSRTFTEGELPSSQEGLGVVSGSYALQGGTGTRISEQITYANGLQQVVQNQAKLQSQNNVLVSQTVQDFSGRPSLTSMAAPIATNSLGFVKQYLQKAPGELYTAIDFDEDNNFDNAQTIAEGPLQDYYSDENADLSIASAEGYPFTRSLYFRDGTNRVKEQGGVGPVHTIRPADTTSHTIRTFYTGVSNDELIRVLGDEAPAAESVYKIINVDANKVATASYISKEGQTIITAISYNGDNNYLDSLPSQGGAAQSINDTFSNGIVVNKPLFLLQDKNITFNHHFDAKVLQDLCTNYITGCQYTVQVLIHNKESSSDGQVITYALNTQNGDYDTTFQYFLPAGDYVIEKRLIVDDPVPGTATDTSLAKSHLEVALDSIEVVLTQQVLDSLTLIRALLDSTQVAKNEKFYLDSLYRYLGVDVQIENAEAVFADSSVPINLGCGTIDIPIMACKTYSCPGNAPDFEGYMTDQWGSVYGNDINDYFNPNELIENGNFETGGTSWNNSNPLVWSFLLGRAEYDDLVFGPSAGNISQSILIEPNKSYIVRFQLSNFSGSDNLVVSLGGEVVSVPQVSGTYNIYYTLGSSISNTNINFFADDGEFFLDNVSVKEAAYVSGGFNNTISNMLNDPAFNYTCDSLWLCWERVVGTYQVMRDLEDSTDDFEYDLLKDFLNCTGGRQIKGFSNVAIHPNNGYLSHAYKIFDYSWGKNTACEEAILNCTTTPCPGGYSDAEWSDFYNCVTNAAPPSAVPPIASLRDSVVQSCSTTCESRRYGFEQSIIDAYHQNQQYVQGDENALVFDSTWGLGWQTSGNPLSGGFSFDVDTETVFCQAEALVRHCQSSCQLDYIIQGNDTVQVGTTAQLDALAEAMTHSYLVDIPSGGNCSGQGFTLINGINETNLGSNQFVDGDFGTMEANVNGFTYFPGISAQQSSTQAYQGTHSLNLQSANMVQVASCTSNIATLEGSNSFICNAWVYVGNPTSGTTPDQIVIGGTGNGITNIVNKTWTPSDGQSQWIEISSTIVVDAGVSVVSNIDISVIGVSIAGHPMNFYIDNIEIRHNDGLTCSPICFKWDGLPTLNPPDSLLIDFEPVSCAEQNAQSIEAVLDAEVANYIDSKMGDFEEQYFSRCLHPDTMSDIFSMQYEDETYHYTLYYYDRAGNLVKTVPPKGVDQDNTSRQEHPDHTFVTEYEYNSLKQLIRQKTPDGGETVFYYDQLGQLRFSQNAQQADEGLYSYTKYDELGRIIEVGESDEDVANLATHTEEQAFPTTGNREETFTVYSEVAPNITYLDGSTQRFLQNRVSYTYTSQASHLSGGIQGGGVVSTYYSYDPHGNVEWIITDIPGIGNNYLRYEYDLISGNVLKVCFNEGMVDEFYHRYTYDEDNRIQCAYTSKDGIIWDRDADYHYYAHGPLRRINLGEDKIQGIDYTYTLQGWLKAVNHASLEDTLDPGNDGSSIVSRYAQDIWGMQLGYHDDDFIKQGSPFIDSNQYALSMNNDLYNGNIANWTWNVDYFHATIPTYNKMTGYQYRYDILNRIKRANFRKYNNTKFVNSQNYKATFEYDANGNITKLNRNGCGLQALPYDTVYHYPTSAYSRNQLKQLQSDAAAGSSGVSVSVSGPVVTGVAIRPLKIHEMDLMTYHYDNETNRLRYIDDAVPQGRYKVDLDDQDSMNYYYDKIGNLTKDVWGKIDTITWTTYGKVSQVIKTTGDTLTFAYDAQGNRVKKRYFRSSDTTVIETFYVRDASGNIMAIYEEEDKWEDTAHLKEIPLYGSERLGTHFTNIARDSIIEDTLLYCRVLDKKKYELKDHLGNVRALVTDRKEPGENAPCSSLDFDGSDDFVTLSSDPMIGLSNFTIEAWIKVDDYLAADRTHGRGFIRISRGDAIGDVLLAVGSNGAIVYTNRKVAGVDPTGKYRTNPNVIQNDAWHHIAAVWDGVTDEIYVDGVSQTLYAEPSGTGFTTEFSIGRGLDESDQHFYGLIDEVRMWDVVRTPLEIQTAMDMPLSGSEPGLVSYWNFDEGEEQTVYDYSDNNNNIGFLGIDNTTEAIDPTWSTEGQACGSKLGNFTANLVDYNNYYPFGMLFPCQQPPAQQMLATFEDSRQQQESTDFYESYDSVKRITMSAMDHTRRNDNLDSAIASSKVLELNKDEAGAKGLMKRLSLVPEDSIVMEVYAKYLPNESKSTEEEIGLPLIPLISTLTNVIPTEFGILRNTIIPPLVNLPLPNLVRKKDKYKPTASLKYRWYNLDSVVVDSGEVKVTNVALDNGKPKRRSKSERRLRRKGIQTNTPQEESHEYLVLTRGIEDSGYIEVFLENASEDNYKVYFDDMAITVMSAQEESEECKYPYAYNGKRMDNEPYGSDGTLYDYGFRIYDPRVARFLSVDPLFKGFPWNSPYSYAEDGPILNIDLDGLEKVDAKVKRRNQVTNVQLKVIFDTEGRPFDLKESSELFKVREKINDRDEKLLYSNDLEKIDVNFFVRKKIRQLSDKLLKTEVNTMGNNAIREAKTDVLFLEGSVTKTFKGGISRIPQEQAEIIFERESSDLSSSLDDGRSRTVIYFDVNLSGDFTKLSDENVRETLKESFGDLVDKDAKINISRGNPAALSEDDFEIKATQVVVSGGLKDKK